MKHGHDGNSGSFHRYALVHERSPCPEIFHQGSSIMSTSTTENHVGTVVVLIHTNVSPVLNKRVIRSKNEDFYAESSMTLLRLAGKK